MLPAIVNRKYTLPYVEMDITSRCTLNCKECSHFIPLRRKLGDNRDYSTESLIENIDLLLPLTNRILLFRLLGGEPFLHRNLHIIVEKLINEKKVKHIQISTNGTIVPQYENFEILKNRKVSVDISNYGELSTKRNDLIKLFKISKIRYKASDDLPLWRETGGFNKRHYSKREMHELFYKCKSASCKTLFEQKLWLCPIALHGFYLKALKKNEYEYIDLSSNKKQFWKELNDLYENPENKTSCYYCNGNNFNNLKQVPCAEQITY